MVEIEDVVEEVEEEDVVEEDVDEIVVDEVVSFTVKFSVIRLEFPPVEFRASTIPRSRTININTISNLIQGSFRFIVGIKRYYINRE